MNAVRRYLPYVIAIVALFAVVAGWCLWWRFGAEIIARYWISSSTIKEPILPVTLTDLGQAGDLFGGFSALFSALAFVGVAIAAYLQRETIQLQRQQIADAKEETVKAMEAARLEHAAADVQQARQAFEPLFFQIVNLLREQTQKMQLTVPDSSLVDANSYHFDTALASIRARIARTWAIQVTPTVPGLDLEVASDYYLRVYGANESHLGPYFRTLYHALKLIHRSNLPENEKVDYANILRGLLTRDELLLVMLNCLSGYGAGLKAFVEIYGILKHITRSDDGTPAIDLEIAASSFAPTATMSWGKRKVYWMEQPRPQTADA